MSGRFVLRRGGRRVQKLFPRRSCSKTSSSSYQSTAKQNALPKPPDICTENTCFKPKQNKSKRTVSLEVRSKNPWLKVGDAARGACNVVVPIGQPQQITFPQDKKPSIWVERKENPEKNGSYLHVVTFNRDCIKHLSLTVDGQKYLIPNNAGEPGNTTGDRPQLKVIESEPVPNPTKSLEPSGESKDKAQIKPTEEITPQIPSGEELQPTEPSRQEQTAWKTERENLIGQIDELRKEVDQARETKTEALAQQKAQYDTMLTEQKNELLGQIQDVVDKAVAKALGEQKAEFDVTLKTQAEKFENRLKDEIDAALQQQETEWEARLDKQRKDLQATVDSKDEQIAGLQDKITSLEANYETTKLDLKKEEKLSRLAGKIIKATHGAGTNKTDLWTALETVEESEVESLKTTYQRIWQEKLEDRIIYETGGWDRAYSMALLSGNRTTQLTAKIFKEMDASWDREAIEGVLKSAKKEGITFEDLADVFNKTKFDFGMWAGEHIMETFKERKSGWDFEKMMKTLKDDAKFITPYKESVEL